MSEINMESNHGIDTVAKTLVATAMAKSLNFVLAREFLELARTDASDQPVFAYDWQDKPIAASPTWFRVSRIGISPGKTCKMYLDAVQRLLHSFNEEAEVLFLVKTNNRKVDLMLGIRFSGNKSDRASLKTINSYANGLWRGLGLVQETSKSSESIRDFKSRNILESNDNAYDTIYAITGIPTPYEEDVLEMTIEKFLSGAANEDMTLLISATPLKIDEIEDSLYNLREVGGQIESMKTMSLNIGTSMSESIQEASSWNESTSRKDFAIVGEKILNFVGDNLNFAPAKAVSNAVKSLAGITPYAVAGYGAIKAVSGALTSAAGTAGAIAGAAGAAPLAAGACIGAVGLLSGFVPQKSTSSGGSHSEGWTTQTSQSITKTIINKHAEAAAEKIDRQIGRYEEGRASGMWNVGVYLFGDKANVTNAAYQFKAVVSGKSTELEPIRIHDITYLLESNSNPFKSINTPQIIVANNHVKFEDTISRHDAELKTILTSKELTGYINFPLKPLKGIIVKDIFDHTGLYEPEYEESIATIELGNLVSDGIMTDLKCKLPLNRLSSHTLVSGINGSGKTNSILYILENLSGHKTPFMVIEPAKTEYVDWALRFNEELKQAHKQGQRKEERPVMIFMPGRKNYRRSFDGKELSIDFTKEKTLKFNPLEAIDLGEDSMNVLAHMDRIKATFAAAFPMQDILPVALETLLYYVYEVKGWLASTDSKPKKFPYMSFLYGCIDAVVKNLGYEEKNTMTIKAALKTRISSLIRGWKGSLLDNDSMSGISWNELFSTPCIINLSTVGDDTDKSFIMALLMQFLYEYREAQACLTGFEYSNDLKHLVVIEEAHRIMSNCTNPDMPQAQSGKMFSTMLSEVRAFGQGLMIVDQVPTRLIPDAVKNTSLKIIHRLVSTDDIDSVASAAGLKDGKSAMISSLPVGEAIIIGADNGAKSENNGEIYWCKVKKRK